VIHHAKHARRIGDGPAGRGQTVQRGGAGAFVQEDPVDGDQIDAAFQRSDDVRIPDLCE
jgi:hypothetical protein